MDILYLLVGLVLIIFAANFMTDGASGIAARFGVSEFIVGVTVVAVGTSSPELVVSLLSALRGETAIALGNVVGSNMFNTLVIVGITAIIMPLSLTADNIRKDIPFGVLATIVLLICASDNILADGATPEISRSDGLLMLCFFVIFLAYTIFSAADVKGSKKVPAALSPQYSQATAEKSGFADFINPKPIYVESAPAAAVGKEKKEKKLWMLIIMTVGGLAGLVLGGDLFLDGAVAIARRFGIGDTVIAVTIVAGGTSLPELAASITAAVKHKPGIALGNILGSNILNIFLVLGASASVAPLQMGDIGPMDLLAVFAAALLMFIAAFTFKSKKIDRAEGVIFVLLYIAYIVWVVIR
ncbi:MAG: calcium/sodium antiporter [Rikenellaceae bacterium]|nr:calcium/sodium antiporter [Rikenellaceae bacterium]